MPTFDGRRYVNSRFVDPKRRRRGIDSKLMNKGIDAGGSEYKMVLDVKTDRPHLQKFYGSMGFAKQYCSRNYYRDGSDRFKMARGGSKT